MQQMQERLLRNGLKLIIANHLAYVLQDFCEATNSVTKRDVLLRVVQVFLKNTPGCCDRNVPCRAMHLSAV